MSNISKVLSAIPSGLRDPLIKEYNNVVNNYYENRWTPSELHGGRFCEIVYTIIIGHSNGTYPNSPSKPKNFVKACRDLENQPNLPRSFRILIPRVLPFLYEIRNNRNVGHVGGDVNSNHMDSEAVVSMAGWILAEMIRILHNVSISEAQLLVDGLTERRILLVWKSDETRRVLDTSLSIKDQILLLISTVQGKISVDELYKWLDYSDKSYGNRLLKQLHGKRFIELNLSSSEVELLPPGVEYVTKIIKKYRGI